MIQQKVGILFTDHLEIQDMDEFNNASLFYRIPLAMPATTNSLEASHGHLNEQVPRRNNFYHAFLKLIKWAIKKTQNFQQLLHKNFNYPINKMKKRFVQNVQMICSENAIIINQQQFIAIVGRLHWNQVCTKQKCYVRI